MKKLNQKARRGFIRVASFCLVLTALVCGTAYMSNVNVSANHPVLVEGNCDSPVPGTTIVTAGTCGDYDGDGRIGTAEDTDGADRIFGTLNAALGPGSGAAAGTGANFNGKIIIVSSGRFAETLYIGNNFTPGGPGVANPGNVTLEAAPGVEATIDAVLQGDPAGGNTARQASNGISIVYSNATTVVTLRNLEIRNFSQGVVASLNSRVNIDKCRFENNRDFGLLAQENSRVVVTNSEFNGNGFRIPVSGPSSPGDGLRSQNSAQVRVAFSNFTHNFGAGLANFSSGAPAGTGIVVFKVTSYFNGSNTLGPITVAPDPNFSNQ